MLPTIVAAAESFRKARSTPTELLEICLERIERLEPGIRAWVFVDAAGAREQAARMTAELGQGRCRGPLHGVPVGIKDIFDVFDWPTAAGSKLWARSIARRDAPVVDRLRQAGAVLLGKTVTTLYASFDPPPTRNPWNPGRTPGGSSSGSAAAVAAGMCPGALASQTGGSITRPAAYCGVASCKPTFGRVSVDGVLPLAPSMDHVGAMARCVRDVAILLGVIAAPPPTEFPITGQPVPDYEQCFRGPLRPPRLGRPRGMFEERAEPSMHDLMDRVCERFRSKGAVIEDIVLPAGFAEVLSRHRTIMAVEAAAYHEQRLARHPDDYGPKITELLNEGMRCSASEYARCKEHQRSLSLEVENGLAAIDALLCPAATSPAPDASTTGDPAFNSPWSYTGVPAISMPAGWTDDGLPLGIQLIGRSWSEANLFAAAAWCEEVLGVGTRDL